jgi:putative sterol carrier protein
MADTVSYFSNLDQRVKAGDFDSASGNVFQFNIAGAGEWFVDLVKNVAGEGQHDSADCTIETDKDTFDAMLDNPMEAMAAFMDGRLTADNPMLAMSLQSFLG